MMKSFSKILQEITGGVNPLCTIAEVAGVMKVHEQTVYGYKNDNTEPNYSKIVDLSHYLIKKYNYHGVALQMMLPCGGTSNGKVEDDLLNLYEFGTDAHRAFQEKDRQEFEKALGRMKAEIKDLEAEAKSL